MTAKSVKIVGLVLVLLLLASSPFSVTPSAQMSASCNREIARQEAALRQFDADARREGMDFARDEAQEAALDGLKARLEGDPTADALEDARQKWEEWKEFIEQGKSIQTIFAEMAQCTKAGLTGCLNELIERNRESDRLLGRVNDAMNDWIESLGNDTISKAAERVERARGVMQNLTTQAGDLATGAASGAMENCFRDMERRVEARRDAVDARSAQPMPQPQLPQPPAPQPPASQPNSGGNSGASGGSGGGIGAGTIAGISAAAVGGGVGLYALNEYAKKAQCNVYETEANSRLNNVINAVNVYAACRTGTCQSQLNAMNSAMSSLLTTLGNWCTCLGPDAVTELSPEDRAAVRDAFNAFRSLGINPGTLPACFR